MLNSKGDAENRAADAGLRFRRCEHASPMGRSSRWGQGRRANAEAKLRPRLKRTVVAALWPEPRAVIELAHFGGHTYRKIAAITGGPIDSIKTRVFDATRRRKTVVARCREEAA